MAIYKYNEFLTYSLDTAFDNITEPGIAAPYAGIYQCIVCQREIAIAEGHTLPSQNHHQHPQGQGRIRWRLIVNADHRPK